MTKVISVGFNTGDVGGDLDRLAAQLDHMGDLGCDGAEVTAVGLDAVVACRLVPARVAEIRATLAARPLAYSLHAPIAVNLMDEADQALQTRAFDASLALAAEIGAAVVVVHPGRCAPQTLVDAEPRLLALERDLLRAQADRAQALGLRIAYENISPNPRVIAGAETSYSLDPARLAAQLDALDHPAAMACLDISHAQQGAGLWGFDMAAACRALSPRVGHIHFSDSTGVPATVQTSHEGEQVFFGVGDMHAPPGWGAVDFDAVAAAVDPLPDTRIVIELKTHYRAHAEAETLAAARAFADRLNGARP